VAYKKVAAEVGVPADVITEMEKLIDGFDPDQAALDQLRPTEKFEPEPDNAE
jgi:hypothetical protein